MIFASVKLTRLTLVLPGTTIIALYATTKRVSIFNACAEILRLRSIHKSLEGAVKLSRYTKLSTFELPGRALFVAGKASAGPATMTLLMRICLHYGDRRSGDIHVTYAYLLETDRKLFRHNILPNISTEYSAETE